MDSEAVLTVLRAMEAQCLSGSPVWVDESESCESGLSGWLDVRTSVHNPLTALLTTKWLCQGADRVNVHVLLSQMW